MVVGESDQYQRKKKRMKERKKMKKDRDRERWGKKREIDRKKVRGGERDINTPVWCY